MQPKNMEGWESSYVYDSESASGVMDPIIIHNNNYNHTNRNSFFPKKLLCKQEIESEALLAANYSLITDTFLQLPQLESPLSTKRTISIVSQNNNNSSNSTTTTIGEINNMNKASKVTDWRELDQFVASQLSQDPKTLDDHDQSLNRHLSSFSHTSDLEALLLLHGGDEREEEVIDAGKLISGFISTSSSADSDNIGICIFDKLNQDIN
ncbi:NAC domain-containing protein 37-like [Chenopodium quinoa]|nr:NAC domain-containing protein 37-like [Chenopodium quinoa]